MGIKLPFASLLISVFLLTANSMAQCPSALTLTLSTLPDSNNAYCQGSTIIFTANATGPDLTYKWYVNTILQGETSNNFTYNTSSDNFNVKVEVASTDSSCTSTIEKTTPTYIVNPLREPTVSIVATKTTICEGESIVFTATPINGGSNPVYNWYIDGNLQPGNTNTLTSTAFPIGNPNNVSVQMTSNAKCLDSTKPNPANSNIIPISVNPGTPQAPLAISETTGNTDLCPGTNATYRVDPVANASEYIWTLPSGWSGSSTTNTINIIYGSSGSGNITVKAKNSCGTSAASSLAVTVNPGIPNTPGTITGNTNVCPNTTENYSISAVPNAIEYIWTLPDGSLQVTTSTSISVTTNSTGNSNISVSASNDCGQSPVRTLPVSVKPGTPTKPDSILGPTNVCPNSLQTYSINPIAYATSYIWTLPSDWTGSSTSTSINVTAGNTSGNITVKAVNDCGTSLETILVVNTKTGVPATPVILSGSNTVCPSSPQEYSVINDTNASEYIWTLPNGWSGTSSTSTVNVTTASSGSGTITVRAKNDCGTSAALPITVNISNPAPIMSGVITGPANVCQGTAGFIYSIPAINNATSYSWSLPSGWTITSGGGTRSITATAGSSGNISVIANNNCGVSNASSNFAVQAAPGLPATPSSISSSLASNPLICPPLSGITFSVTSVPNTTYNWILPAGWEITSGANTNSIVARANASTPNGTQSVKVEAVNACGKSGQSSFNDINVADHVYVNLGDDLNVCKSTSPININASISFNNKSLRVISVVSNGTGNFNGLPNSNQKVDNFNFLYTPSQNDIDTKSEILITLTTEQPNGACTANSSSDVMKIIFRPDPAASIAGATSICAGNATDITFTGTPNSIVTYRKGTGPNLTIPIGPSGNAVLNTGALSSTTIYDLVSVQHSAAPSCSKNITGSATVTVTPKPTANITYGGNPFCTTLSTAQPVTLTGTGPYTGGTFSASSSLSINTISGAITPSTSTPGTYTVSYETLASGGCTKTIATTQVIITKAPTANINYLNKPFCTSITVPQAVTLTGTDAYTGGTFLASPAGLNINSSTGAINPSASTPGTYTVTYETLPGGGCAKVAAVTSVTITAAPTATITYVNSPYCDSDTTIKQVTLTGSGTYTGGTFSFSPAGLSINQSNGEINPSLSSPGSYTVNYELPANGGCPELIVSTDVTITKLPYTEINYSSPICQSNSTIQNVSFSNSVGDYLNGTFSGTAGLNINSITGEINASSSQSGNHTISYTIPTQNGCSEVIATTQIDITPLPQATIGYNGPFCTSNATSTPVTFTNTAGTYQNGVFSGSPGLSISADGSIIPANSSPGTHTVTYTISNASGCEEVISTTQIDINEKVNINEHPSSLSICSTNSAEFNVSASPTNATFQWYKNDVLIPGETSSSLSFNNATSADAGKYYVVVSGQSVCEPVTSEEATLQVDEEIKIIKPAADITICENELDEITFEYIAHAKGAILTFIWIKDGEELTDPDPNTTPPKYTYTKVGPTGENGEYSGLLTISNITIADNGVYAVKIKGPDYFTCQEAVSKSFTLSVKDQPDSPATTNISYCQEDVAVPLTAEGTNLKWYSSEFGEDLIPGTPTPDTSSPAILTYWVSQITDECESERAQLDVIIKEKPGVPSTTQTLTYCLNDPVSGPLTATGVSGATINWYNAIDSTTPLDSAPTPNTSADITSYYWVSQTLNGCESDRLQVSIIVNKIPTIAVTAANPIICSGSSTTLTATGGSTYIWDIDGTNGATKVVSPTTTTTYQVTGTNSNGCSSTSQVTVTVDQPSIGGVVDGNRTVCVSGNAGTLTLTGQTGNIIRWEKSVNSGTSWTAINNTTTSLAYSNLIQNTIYRAVVKSGICSEVTSTQATITVDPVPIGGKLLFSNANRIYLTCEQPTLGSLSSISISGNIGNIIAWKYRTSTSTSWATIMNGANNFTGTTLSAAQVHGLGVNETLVFQVEIASGTCSPNALSQTAILSVIPSDIEPTPVTIDPDVICYGDEVTLHSSTGYGNPLGKIEGGAFDNAGLVSNGWRFRRQNNNVDLIFETDANNRRPDRWERATRHQFTTATISDPFTISESNYISSNGPNNPSGNKGFAIVSSNNSATMETPVFSLGSLDQAIISWDQMYNLTPGASITVEISTDGGANYNNIIYTRGTAPFPGNNTGISSSNYDGFSVGTIADRPNNKIQVDLGNYMGQQQLRIRFNYTGIRLGDVWAVDNINIPDGPAGVDLVWYDYTDPDNPVYIGNSETETWFPTRIGYNEFEVRTKLLLDSGGNSCQSIENFERVIAFAFDQYISTTTVITGTCGTTEAQLSGVVEGIGTVNGGAPQGIITSYPTLDGYSGAWTVSGPTNYTFSESHFTSTSTPAITPASKDPNAIFNPGISDTFTLTWTLTPNAFVLDNQGNNFPVPVNEGCPPTYNPANVNTLDCTTLDFDGVDDVVVIDNDFADVKSIEAWIRPEAAGGTIISGPTFEIMTPTDINYNGRWYHIAVIFTGADNGLYIDGIKVGNAPSSNGGGTRTSIGAKWTSADTDATDHFSGWIEEVRIWKNPPTLKEIKYMMNQRLKLDASGTLINPIEGEIIPNKPISGSYFTAGGYNLDKDADPFYNQTGDDLLGYYRLISSIPDPSGLGAPWGITFAVSLMPQNGITPDLAMNNAPGRLYNMTTDQENTAPMPYISANDGLWSTKNTWLRPLVWDAPNSNGIDWNIIRTNHNIQSGDRDITVLGLKSETLNKLIEISGPGTKNENNAGQMLRVTHYLKLDGNIDLVGESQLLQDQGSILDAASAGWLEKDQQGHANSFIYNYWSSPVSLQGDADNNTPYSILEVMKYGTNSDAPTNFNLVNGPFSADDTALNSSTYWFWRFHGLADDYDSWIYIGDDLGGKKLNTGEAHTMKGVNGSLGKDAMQNYVYRGKPHNGDISLAIGPNQNYLIGNPYSSALNGKEFILDNINNSPGRNGKNIFNGTLYFWDHFETTNHNLREYIGGYAVLNLLDGVPAASVDERIDNSNSYSGRAVQKTPNHYIPVGQGFFISTVDDLVSDNAINNMGGTFTFKNSQRIYKRENNTDRSIFLKPEIHAKPSKENNANKEEVPIEKIRLRFVSPQGYNRQILVGAHPATTSGFDIGYDAPMIENNVEDMYWLLGYAALVIQGVPDFNEDRILPLGIKLKQEGNFEFKIDTLENVSNLRNIYIKDKVNDTIHNLRSSSYKASSTIGGYIEDRFEIVFFKPIELTDPIGGGDPVIDDPDPIDIPGGFEFSVRHSYTYKEIQILNPEMHDISHVYLFDMNGNLIQEYDKIPLNDEILLRVRNYSTGVYILKVYTEDKVINRKIIIKD